MTYSLQRYLFHASQVFRGGYSVEPSASLYALAMVVRTANKNYKVVNEAYKAARKLSEDNGEHFLIFTHYLREIARSDEKKGFGKGWRVSVQKWYESKDAMQLAQLATKVPATMKWNHRDIIALSRLKLPSDIGNHLNISIGITTASQDTSIYEYVFVAKATAMSYLKNGYEAANTQYSGIPEAKQILEYLKSVKQIRCAESESALINSITLHNFSIEYVPSKFLSSHEVNFSIQKIITIDINL